MNRVISRTFFKKDGIYTIELGNFFYFIPIIILLLVVYFSIKLCNKKGKKFANYYIIVILFCNFALHFFKQLFPTYSKGWPNTLWKSSFENLCATLIMLAPFIYLSKNKYLKDYMFYLGIISGAGVYFFPYGSMSRDLTNIDNLIDIVRFYVCHCPLILCGLLMVQQGFHKLNYRRLWAIAFSYTFLQTIVFLNDVVLFAIGVPDFKEAYGSFTDIEAWKLFLYRNGPANESVNMGFKEDFDKLLGWAYIPFLMTYKMDSRTYFVPVLYQFIPVFLVSYPIGMILSFPWQKEQMKIDYMKLKIKLSCRNRC